MGIRYYGWAISPEEVNEATDDPWPVIRRADKRHSLPGWTNTDFDKAWRLMQQLFRPGWDQVRPAYQLVAGDVTYPYGYERGYLPHIGVLPADLVRLLPATWRQLPHSTSTTSARRSATARSSIDAPIATIWRGSCPSRGTSPQTLPPANTASCT